MTLGLEEIPEEFGAEVGERLQGFVAPDTVRLEDIPFFQADFEGLPAILRALAISQLLVYGDVESFHGNLIRGAKARIYYLTACGEAGHEDETTAASRNGAFLDALAASAFDLAADLARLSTREWQPDDEYEDDYWYARFLYGLLVELRPEELSGTLDRFERALEGAPSARLEVARAVLEADQEGFDAAFRTLIQERSHRIDQDIEQVLYVDESILTDRLVFVEGLALLRLAERRGLSTEPEYEFCPSLARQPLSDAFTHPAFP